MKKVLILSNEFSFQRNILSVLDKTKYSIQEASATVENIFSYCLRTSPEILIIHTSYLNGHYSLFEQLLNTNRFLILYISTKMEYGALYNVMSNPKFYILSEGRIFCIHDILDILDRDNQIIHNLNEQILKYKESLEEEKNMRKAKLSLMKKRNLKEEEAYKLILKVAMDCRISKSAAAIKLLEEVEM